MKKRLSRIRLINWHYFRDETISLAGSTLISGENTSGKSTLLDAIQLVLTTNTRKFNTAANEKSNRDLKGYVRCKIGNVGQTYLRKNSVIAYVALEFFEEKTEKKFVLGVQLLSPDEESKVTARWFIEEGVFEDICFITDKHPSMPDEFKKNGKKISLIDQVGTAKERFKRRMGSLEERFFDMIPKSLAFKPMDNVKGFINKFILPEENIDINELRVSINTLSDLEELMNCTKKQLELLGSILEKHEEIQAKEKEKCINEIMIKFAAIDEYKRQIGEKEHERNNLCQKKQARESERRSVEEKYKTEQNRLFALRLSVQNNEVRQLIEKTERKIEEYQKDLDRADNEYHKLSSSIKDIEKAARKFASQDENIVTKAQLECLLREEDSIEAKSQIINTLEGHLEELGEKYNREFFKCKQRYNEINDSIKDTIKLIKELENKNLRFPDNTIKLREAIEKEFKRQGISSKIWVLSELLEVTDAVWQDAVEGYLNTQRFYILVEPQYYNKALAVYRKMQHEIHTVGLINTRKLNLDNKVHTESLAYVVKSQNRYAKAYADFLLGKVTRCNDIFELENYKVAITSECMLYQNYAVRKIDEKVYKTPYIGSNAFVIQKENAEKKLKALRIEYDEQGGRIKLLEELLKLHRSCRVDVIRENLDSPAKKRDLNKQIDYEKQQLREAKKDPSLIELMQQIEDCEKRVEQLEKQKRTLSKEVNDLEYNIRDIDRRMAQINKDQSVLQEEADSLKEQYPEEQDLAIKKYEDNRKTKAPREIADNFTSRNARLETEKEALLNGKEGLCFLQQCFNRDYESDFEIGEAGIQDYIDRHYTLESSQIVKYEEELRKAKENCEEIFRVSFLAKMKENIERAKNEFKELNHALQNIYYGEDSYYFEITYDKKKESLYNMILSENNMEGYTLWSSTFQEEYKEEIADLFAKLMANDDKGEKVLAEYTDYRSYLDYDIEVRKKDGTKQKFSRIYGEKSGGETQTPYYVAIAASFYQLYKYGDTIRILLLDEAFDKMDENRIASMMDFFNQLDFQIIIATPPAKIEVIGEKVDTILVAIRQNDRSIIETYEL